MAHSLYPLHVELNVHEITVFVNSIKKDVNEIEQGLMESRSRSFLVHPGTDHCNPVWKYDDREQHFWITRGQGLVTTLVNFAIILASVRNRISLFKNYMLD